MISNRVVENLRRKNEAMKQASKRERSDPSAHMVPSVSPCCLNDDSVSLRLLVKLGKSQEAATAYSARRSLLLLERYGMVSYSKILVIKKLEECVRYDI